MLQTRLIHSWASLLSICVGSWHLALWSSSKWRGWRKAAVMRLTNLVCNATNGKRISYLDPLVYYRVGTKTPAWGWWQPAASVWVVMCAIKDGIYILTLICSSSHLEGPLPLFVIRFTWEGFLNLLSIASSMKHIYDPQIILGINHRSRAISNHQLKTVSLFTPLFFSPSVLLSSISGGDFSFRF